MPQREKYSWGRKIDLGRNKIIKNNLCSYFSNKKSAVVFVEHIWTVLQVIPGSMSTDEERSPLSPYPAIPHALVDWCILEQTLQYTSCLLILSFFCNKIIDVLIKSMNTYVLKLLIPTQIVNNIWLKQFCNRVIQGNHSLTWNKFP